MPLCFAGSTVIHIAIDRLEKDRSSPAKESKVEKAFTKPLQFKQTLVTFHGWGLTSKYTLVE